MSNSETNLLKFELGISNDSPSLLNLPLVSERIITLSAARQLVDAMAMK
jgi:hypothetical protein